MSFHLVMTKYPLQNIRWKLLQSGAAGWGKGFVTCLLEVPLACLGSMAAAVQPSCQWNSQKTCYRTFSSTCRPRQVTLLTHHFQEPFLQRGWDILEPGGISVASVVAAIRPRKKRRGGRVWPELWHLKSVAEGKCDESACSFTTGTKFNTKWINVGLSPIRIRWRWCQISV